MQNHKVVEVDSHKHLGVVLSSDCSWHQHIKYITDKAWNRINIMRKLKFKLDRKSLEIIYIAFIRPLLEYGDIIWDNLLYNRVFNCFKQHVYYVSINSFIYYVSKNNFLEQHVYNNMMFTSLILD